MVSFPMEFPMIFHQNISLSKEGKILISNLNYGAQEMVPKYFIYIYFLSLWPHNLMTFSYDIFFCNDSLQSRFTDSGDIGSTISILIFFSVSAG